jgi:uncharacterized metal-binding protein YceD (DUF177 family)
MRQRKVDKSAPAPWSLPVAMDDIEETGRHFTLAAAPEIRAELARIAGVLELPRLEAEFDVTRRGAGLHVAGRVCATVGQRCVVTLEPLSNQVDEEVDLLFMPPAAAARGDGEAAEPTEAKWDDPEPLIGGKIDLGAIATEFLVLGIDPYPRKPGAVFEPPREHRPDVGPFAGLAGWTKGRSDS